MRVRGPESQLDWLAVVSLWLGAILFAVKTADIPLPVGAPVFLASHLWNILPAILLSIAMAIFIFRQLQSTTAPRNSTSLASSQSVARAHRSPHAPTVEQPPNIADDRVFVSEGTTPQKLMEMCENKTTHQGQLSLKPFLGKWMRISGAVGDFSMLSEDFACVTLGSPPAHVFEGLSIPDIHCISLYFRSGFERLETLHGGELIVADGKIREIDSYVFKLDYCEIVSIRAPSD